MDALTTSVCRSCRQRLTTAPLYHKFSTSTRRQVIPPESPAFIDVPSSLQPELKLAPRRKGVLPVPREIFPANRPDKPSQEYLDNVTRDPAPHNVKPLDQLDEQQKYRLRMAETRKRHLREGLTELYKRKQETNARLSARSHKRQSERARLLTQPEREDSRLTNNSTPQALLHTKSSTPVADDLAIARSVLATKQANHARVSSAQKHHRLDALHTLYMNARSFITTEPQLDAAIDEQFHPDAFKNSYIPGKSIWNMGPPDTIREMIAANQISAVTMADAMRVNNRAGGTAMHVRYAKEQERMKQIAEKLSGGKI